MKRLATSARTIGLSIVSALVASSALAATMDNGNNWYGSVSGDATWPRHSDTGGGGNAALGYQFPSSSAGDFRLEAEAGYHAAPGSDSYSSTHYYTYMGNAYYDFNHMFSPSSGGWHVVPYIGGGIGDAQVHYGSASPAPATHENVLAYQGMAGLTFASATMPGTDWSLGYRYVGSDSTNINANNAELGMHYRF
jgi:hypothetical protein